MSGVVLNNTLKDTLLSLQKTSSAIDDVTLRLASGLKVNSAIDGPQNYFTASSLNSQASDLSRLLDGISQNIKALDLAANGLEAISKYISQAEAIVRQRQSEIEALDKIPVSDNGESYLSNLITGEGADFYFRLDDTGPGVDSSGDVGTSATYSASVLKEQKPLFEGSNGSAYFNGTNASVSIGYNALLTGNSAQKSIELVFNAKSVTGRHTIYSEGNATRGIDIYTLGNELYITAINTPAFGGASSIPQPVFHTTIKEGKTYHAALVFSRSENRLEAYVNGESIGSSKVGSAIFLGHNAPTLGRQSSGTKTLHDGVSSTSNYFKGYISDVAVHNTVLSDDQIKEHARAVGVNGFSSTISDYENVVREIQRTAIDSNYRGSALLRGEGMKTIFNADGSSYLITKGIDLVSRAGGLPTEGFDDLDSLEGILSDLRDFRLSVFGFLKSLTTDLNIIKTRQTFTKDQINTLSAGRDDLTLADQNQDGATLLALQTRQLLGVTALSLAAQSSNQTLRIF